MVKKMRKMELIKDEKALLLTCSKRKANLLKKISELSILCGIDACIVIFGPQISHHHPVGPETWPSDPDEINRIIDRFIRSNQPRRRSYVSDYFADNKKKVDSEIAELRQQNFKARFYTWHQVIDTFLEGQLRAFLSQLSKRLEIAAKRLQMLKQNRHQEVELRTQDMTQLRHGHNGSFTDLLFFGGPRLPDPPVPAVRFHPENLPLNPNLVDRNIGDNNGYATRLPFHVEPVKSSCRAPLMDDLMMNMLNNHNKGNLINDQCIPQSGLSYVSPLSWMRNNDAMFYNANSYMQPMLPQFQLPLQSNMAYHPPLSNELNGNMELEEKGHEWKWKLDF